MMTEDERTASEEAASAFAREIGVTHVDTQVTEVGNKAFLKFIVGRPAPIYDHALLVAQRSLSTGNPFRGLLNVAFQKAERFPQSLEADVLQNILTRGTRHIAQETRSTTSLITNVPFQNREDQKVIQPATHLIVGRRGVGKSTLISLAAELLQKAKKLYVVLDMQAYTELTGDRLYAEVLHDFCKKLADQGEKMAGLSAQFSQANELRNLASVVHSVGQDVRGAVPQINRILTKSSAALNSDIFLFLDDFHLVDPSCQPELLNILHGCVKGARGWLKVAGLRTQLRSYDPKSRKGLQVPGDAQEISLDFTLIDPESAEKHLRAILQAFLSVVGVEKTTSVINEAALMRLVWANAGVPRDFLQMFGKALEYARRSSRWTVTLTDVNLAIGEFGQQKMDYLEQDARNEQNTLKNLVDYLERYCLDERHVNGFLIRNERTTEKRAVEVLSDLRLVHLIHQTITPHKAGERYEAYLVDYSLFTGFRRRPNIKELLPEDGKQFKAKELRKLPELPAGFLQG
jgi:energy-coupling factor transporter ATP-binding protein EcfA2